MGNVSIQKDIYNILHNNEQNNHKNKAHQFGVLYYNSPTISNLLIILTSFPTDRVCLLIISTVFL